MDPERYADKLIKEALDRGEMDGVSGTGKPLGVLANDQNWWLKAFLAREELPERYNELRQAIDSRRRRAINEPDLATARAVLAESNKDARRWNSEAPAEFDIPEMSEIDLVTERARRPASEGRTSN